MRTVLLLLLTCLVSIHTQAAKVKTPLDQKLDSISNAVEKAEQDLNWGNAYQLANLYCNICDTTKATFTYSKMLGLLATQAFNQGRQLDALTLGNKVVEIRRKADDCEPRHLATALSNLAAYYQQAGNADMAVKHCSEALDIFKEHHYKDDQQQATAMANMAAFLSSRNMPGDNLQAVIYSLSALKNMKKDTREYLNAMGNLAVAYAQVGYFTKANDITEKALKSGKKIYAGAPGDYAQMLANHAVRLANQNAYTAALQYADKAEAYYQLAGRDNSLAYAELLINRGGVLTALEKYSESIECLGKAQELLKGIVPNDHPDNIRCISELAVAHNKMGNTDKAESYSQQLEKSQDNTLQADGRMAHVLVKQAEMAAGAGDWQRAIRLEKTAVSHFHILKNRSDEAASLGNIARYKIALQEYDEAIKTSLGALDLLANAHSDTIVKADLYATLAMAYHYKEQNEMALTYAKRSIVHHKQNGDTVTTAYAKSLGNLALYTYMVGDTIQAIAFAEQAKDKQIAILGYDHPDNAALFYNLARYYCGNDANKVQHYYHKAFNMQRNVVRSNFSHLTTNERENFWNTKSYLFKAAPVLAYMNANNDSVIADAFNAQLFTKGLLLNSEINFRTFLTQTGDSTLLKKYERLETLNQEITKAYNLPPKLRAVQIEKASNEATQIEKQLIRDCKQFGDFMAGLQCDLKDISKALKPHEMAIEMMNLYVEGWGDTYLALYLKQGWQAPKCKMLFSDYDLEKIGYPDDSFSKLLNDSSGINSVYGNPAVGQMVWGKLLPEMEDVKTVFFAPTGMAYQLGVENLAIDSLSTFANQYECYRLSSTRLITNRDSNNQKYNAASVFGGLKYDMTKDEIGQAHEKTKNYAFDNTDIEQVDWAAELTAMAELNKGDFRDGVSYLPGTLTEAENIGHILMQKDITTNMFEMDMGTEEAFKALSGKQQSIIHIATHGFALSASGVSGGAFNFRIADMQADNPLSRCGLLLAGANYAIQGGKLPDGIENGVLTAREIAQLNLNGAQIVALSACRTGVGEVRDDGVFGLQRGFKKAGAKTLLMSLWKVSDQATMTMMSAFYEALMQGQSKHQAYATAQEAVRQAGYNKPFYWASFILLDAM